MNFHLEFYPKQFDTPIQHQHHLLLVGSCFTEQIGAKLVHHKWKVLENPNGILFNPASITQSVQSYISGKQYTGDDLFYHNEAWHSWQHHSRFSHPDKATCLADINASQEAAHRFILTADWILITVGSAFVYALTEGQLVANCHKVPTDKFDKKLMAIEEVVAGFNEMLFSLQQVNPGVKVIFTVSPVRHLRDGFVENNRSKATLLHAVHQVVDHHNNAWYFPAYELVIDDLRDYRFYAEDMVHPNYAATNYVWEKFTTAYMEEPTRQLMKEINGINAAKQHKPFNPGSNQHQQFLASHLLKVKRLQQQYPYINFEAELHYFSSV